MTTFVSPIKVCYVRNTATSAIAVAVFVEEAIVSAKCACQNHRRCFFFAYPIWLTTSQFDEATQGPVFRIGRYLCDSR